MSTEEKRVADFTAVESGDVSSNASMDADARRLAEMGYTEGMQRNHSVISVLGVGFSLTNSWWAVSAALVTGIYSGGPVLLIYGILGLFFISLCVGTSLSELVSAFPNAAGQSFWASELAPQGYTKLASYVTGYFAWAGSIFACASVALSVGFALVGCYVLAHPGFEYKVWHIFLAYQVVNIFSFIFNCHGKSLPLIAKISLYTSLISFIVILITVPAAAPTHQDAKFVFATFINSTGWKSGGIAFIVGLINTNWGFSCLDTAVHLAEEVHQPERMVPIAIMGTVIIGFVTSWFFSMSMMFSINHFSKIANTATGVPMLELFYQALQNKAGAIVLESLVIATGFGCMIACQTWASRLAWSFARDGGMPGHKWMGQINQKLDVPLNAHAVNSVIVAALGCLYIASYAAINAIISACIVLPYVSYSIPIICLLIRGRDNIHHGPFWLGLFGHISNYVTLAWVLFTFVMYSFPSYMPVEADSMNYVSGVYAAVILIIFVDWFARARRSYRSKDDRAETAEELVGQKPS